MNRSIAAKLTQLCVRLEELNRLLSSESITVNLDQYRKLARERAEIAPVVDLYNAYLQSEQDIHTAQEMAADGSVILSAFMAPETDGSGPADPR